MKRQTDTAPETTTTTGSTPGAGRAANGKHIPSKRLKASHRKYGSSQPLKTYAMDLVDHGSDASISPYLQAMAATAKRWFASKAAPR